uniref:Uncharacterized protein n=1 Tax=Anopheles farauti TaxID=69004 RepID=A0A182QK54_9DIPT
MMPPSSSGSSLVSKYFTSRDLEIMVGCAWVSEPLEGGRVCVWKDYPNETFLPLVVTFSAGGGGGGAPLGSPANHGKLYKEMAKPPPLKSAVNSDNECGPVVWERVRPDHEKAVHRVGQQLLDVPYVLARRTPRALLGVEYHRKPAADRFGAVPDGRLEETLHPGQIVVERDGDDDQRMPIAIPPARHRLPNRQQKCVNGRAGKFFPIFLFLVKRSTLRHGSTGEASSTTGCPCVPQTGSGKSSSTSASDVTLPMTLHFNFTNSEERLEAGDDLVNVDAEGAQLGGEAGDIRVLDDAGESGTTGLGHAVQLAELAGRVGDEGAGEGFGPLEIGDGADLVHHGGPRAGGRRLGVDRAGDRGEAEHGGDAVQVVADAHATDLRPGADLLQLRRADQHAPGGIGFGRLQEAPDLADLRVRLHVPLVDRAHLVHVQERQQLIDLSAQVLPVGSTEHGQQDEEFLQGRNRLYTGKRTPTLHSLVLTIFVRLLG